MRWRVVVGGVSVNLALGSLYAWSVFVPPLEKEFGWTRAQTSWVYTIAVVTFAATLMLAGRLQVVSRQTRAGRRPHGRWVRRRLRDHRSDRRSSDRVRRLAAHVPSSCRALLRDGDDRHVADDESAGRVSP